MKALVVLLATLPFLLIIIVFYYSEEIWKEITEYISSESETHKSQKKSNRNSFLSEQPKLWKTYSPNSILEEAKKTWYKVNNGQLSTGDSNVTEPNKFQLFSSNGKIIEGQFIKQGNNWIEFPKNADYYFTFREVKRDQEWIHLHDVSRNYSAKLPFKLGFMLLRTGKSFYKYKPVLPVRE